jgi:biopolymer transport protein ExbD
MAEIDSGGKGGGKKKGSKKVSTKVDMTPMVDLAFLLITFFMLTTTFNKPQIMEVNMPDKTDKPEDNLKTKESTTLTFILGKEDKVFYFQGLAKNNPDVTTTNFSEEDGVRKVLLTKKVSIKRETGEDMVVIIKAVDESVYKNVVDMLDEMSITGVSRYALVDLSADESKLLATKGL